MEDLHKYTIIGNFEISDLCLQTYPCKHNVKNRITCESSLMYGDEIFILLKNIGKSHKHFDDYAEFIRKRDHPTLEEISEKEALIKTLYREQKERKIEKQEKITNQYKASSRLERLKAKNNC